MLEESVTPGINEVEARLETETREAVQEAVDRAGRLLPADAAASYVAGVAGGMTPRTKRGE